jgi:hypothetical protein
MVRGLLIASLLFATPAGAETMQLQPTGKWVVDYADTQCTATRSFGTLDGPLHLSIKPSPTSDVVQIALLKDGKRKVGVQDSAMLKMGDRSPVEVGSLEYGLEKTNVRLINLDGAHAAHLAQASTIEWSSGTSRTVLRTGSLHNVMKTLADCRQDLRNHWNIDEAKQATFKSRAKADIRQLFSSGDYPVQAVQQSDSGTTSVVLLVDEKGAVKECMIDGTSNIPTLDAMTCIVLRQRAKFQPAVGPDGKPIRDSVASRIRWEMP